MVAAVDQLGGLAGELRVRVPGNALRWLRDPTGGTLGGVTANVLALVLTRGRGTHVIHYGGDYDSYILLQVVPEKTR